MITYTGSQTPVKLVYRVINPDGAEDDMITLNSYSELIDSLLEVDSISRRLDQDYTTICDKYDDDDFQHYCTENAVSVAKEQGYKIIQDIV